MRTALVAGATGMVGAVLLEQLLTDPDYHEVKTLSRRSVHIEHTKLSQIIVDYEDLNEVEPDLRADDVFCCLGTTMRTAGSKEAFRKVDFEYPFSLASLTRKSGAQKFLIVSAVGANKHSRIFYSRVKGEVEEAIASVGFPTLHIFRPSLLVGNRMEQRPGEKSAIFLMGLFRFMMPKKYRSIEAAKVAGAMRSAAKRDDAGVFVHDSAEMQHT